MKYLPLLAILLLFTSSASAQTYSYVPIPSDSASWRYARVNEYQLGVGHRGFKNQHAYVTFAGRDTVMAGLTYHIMDLYSAQDDNGYFFGNGGMPPPMEMGKQNFNIYLLQAGKKVYSTSTPQPIDTNTAKPMLDFSVGLGGNVLGRDTAKDSVTLIDTVTVNGTLRKRFIMNNDAIPNADTIIEGIGSTKWGLNFDNYLGGLYSVDGKLFCMTEKGQTLYSYYGTCPEYWPLSLGETVKVQDNISVSPNPFGNELKLTLNEEASVTMYNVSGQVCYNKLLQAGTHLVDTHRLDAGVYFIAIQGATET
ncbi:MAG: T9SS type A sorting domain-containing protein, partial [Chitinophagaceae bacterium]|nr:T9SS type A sorting domain-containing protein [Chitinophagaceae bacterium]